MIVLTNQTRRRIRSGLNADFAEGWGVDKIALRT